VSKRRSEDQDSADRDQTLADREQTLADRDQTLADRDQTLADRDIADSIRDEETSAADQLIADRSGHGTASEDLERESGRLARAEVLAHRRATRLDRSAASVARDETAAERDETAARRDEAAARRDEAARQRDDADRDLERRLTASGIPVSDLFQQIRANAAAARARASVDRERAAADRASAARDRLRLERELEEAHLDDLTGAWRRNAGWLAMTNEIERARRGDGRLVLAFADIDGMKEINDQRGHAAGDRVLQVLVAAMRSHLRAFDPIVRYGGDEFVCALGGVDRDDVEHRFVAIARIVRDEVDAGVSAGIATLRAEETLDEIVARADELLLEAKRSHGITDHSGA